MLISLVFNIERCKEDSHLSFAFFICKCLKSERDRINDFILLYVHMLIQYSL